MIKKTWQVKREIESLFLYPVNPVNLGLNLLSLSW
jgi:hypothetical protein